MDPEVESSLDDKYSVTSVVTKVLWYSLCLIWIKGGASRRSDGGCTWWVVGGVGGRLLCGYGFMNAIMLWYLDGIFLGRVNGCKLGASDGDFQENIIWTPAGWFGKGLGQRFWMGVKSGRQMVFSSENFNWTPAGWYERSFCRKFPMGPSWMMCTNLWSEFSNGPRMGYLEWVSVGNCDGEVLEWSNGVFVGRSAKRCLLVHQTGPG